MHSRRVWGIGCGAVSGVPWLAVVATVVSPLFLAAQDGGARMPVEPATIDAVRITTPIVVDGRLDEAAWASAGTLELAWEIEPADNGPAPVRTVCRIAHDDDHLYLGCEAADPDPEGIRAFVSDRDDLEGQDRIALLLDLFGDRRRAVELSVSAVGVQRDAVVTQSASSGGGERDASWDAIWSSDGRITEDGYVVETAIPFRSLRFPRSDGEQRWGLQITRWWPRSQLVRLRSVPLDRANQCELCQSGELGGLVGVRPGRSVQVTPTLTAGRSDALGVEPGAGLESGPVVGDVGVTATWSVLPGLTLAATANPDFSQVEADVAQLDVNSPVALFFPEKRPFFLEGADLFSTPLRVVSTRSIADPDLGLKLTGKAGGTALGLLVARDASASLLLPAVQTSEQMALDRDPTTVVARIRRDLGRSSTVGALFTSRSAGDYANHVTGADAFLHPLAPLRVRLQLLRSWTEDPPDIAEARSTPSSGSALQGQVNWSTSGWVLNSTFYRRTEGFRADAGFVPEVGRRGGVASVQKRFWGGRDTWFSRIGLQAGTWRNETQQGELIDGNGMWVGLEYDGPGQVSFNLFPNLFFESRFAGRTYSMSSYYGGIGARPWSGVNLRLDAEWGDAIDFQNERKADNLVLSPAVELRLGRSTDLRLSHSVQRLSTAGREIVAAAVSQGRAVYNFSTRSFLRAIVQLRSTRRDPSLYGQHVPARTRRVFTQLLYSYKLDPESVLFLGYTDALDARAEHATDDSGLEREGRSFFLKMSYAWRP